MTAYEFYRRDTAGATHLVGILPERRKNPARITDESILNWLKKLMGDGIKDFYFTQVILDDG
jgi:hypothetical protein